MTTKIRPVSELEQKRVELSEQIEQLQAKGTTTADLEKIKKLRQQLGSVKDELQISKNIELEQRIQGLKTQARELESEAKGYHERIQELALQTLPLLQQLEPLLSELSQSQKKMTISSQDAGKKKEDLWKEHGETLEVESYNYPLVSEINPEPCRDYIKRIEGLMANQQVQPQANPQAKDTAKTKQGQASKAKMDKLEQVQFREHRDLGVVMGPDNKPYTQA